MCECMDNDANVDTFPTVAIEATHSTSPATTDAYNAKVTAAVVFGGGVTTCTLAATLLALEQVDFIGVTTLGTLALALALAFDSFVEALAGFVFAAAAVFAAFKSFLCSNAFLEIPRQAAASGAVPSMIAAKPISDTSLRRHSDRHAGRAEGVCATYA